MRVYLRPPTAADERELLALARESRPLHHPWVSALPTRAASRE